jgi:FkbH-like protein
MDGNKTKLVIWDLDNTVWQGVLSEGDDVSLRPGIGSVMEALDQRGILQSVSSKNNHDDAFRKLEEFGLAHFFLYPKINWDSKSENIKKIIEQINISQDTVAFIDDQAFERDEVKFSLPDVTVISAEDIDDILSFDSMNPVHITEDSRLRRSMYQNDIKRNEAESGYNGTKEEFLSSLQMRVIITPALEEHLQRAEELTARTHQLNSTGYVYPYDELARFIESDEYRLWIVDMSDRYGIYGKIGLVLIHCNQDVWTLKLLLTSCRVISRGIGSLLLSIIINKAIQAEKRLLAEFVPTDRNRIMLITYSMLGFKEYESNGNTMVLEYKAGSERMLPKYFDIVDETGPVIGN